MKVNSPELARSVVDVVRGHARSSACVSARSAARVLRARAPSSRRWRRARRGRSAMGALSIVVPLAGVARAVCRLSGSRVRGSTRVVSPRFVNDAHRAGSASRSGRSMPRMTRIVCSAGASTRSSRIGPISWCRFAVRTTARRESLSPPRGVVAPSETRWTSCLRPTFPCSCSAGSGDNNP